MNQEEIKLPLADFKNFKEFFAREFKSGLRPFYNPNDNSILCSPADSTVVAYGEVIDSKINCVKGHSYSVGELLYGEKYAAADIKKLFTSLETNPNQTLYYAVLYLPPYDLHRYYSPTTLFLKERRHVVGLLNPVKPKYLLKHRVILNFDISMD